MGVSRDPSDGRDKVPSSPVKDEEIIEEEEEGKPKAKPKAKSRAKPKIKITKEPVEITGVSQDPPDGRGKAPSPPIVEEEPAPVKVDKLKQIVKLIAIWI